MSITVRRIHVDIVDHALRPGRLVVSMAGAHSQSRYAIVTLETDQGVIGYGEAATTPLWSGESADTAKIVIDTLIAPRLQGITLDDPREAQPLIDSATWANPFSKAAVDIAVWDAFAKAQHQPVTALFGDRDVLTQLPTRCSVGAFDVDRTVRDATAFWNEGVRVLKFKTGMPGDTDAQRLAAVRDALGDEPIFTVDYNGAYDNVADAVKSIESLEPFGLALVEQPTHRDRLKLLADVKREVSPLMLADEAIFTPQHLAEALDLDAFDMLSIYPGKNGGFTHAINMAQTAQRAGKPCVIGSNLETDLGQAAMTLLAAGLTAFPASDFAGDFPGTFFYVRSSVKQPLAVEGGRIAVPTGAGFGVEPVA